MTIPRPTLIEANRLRRVALNTQARAYHDIILAQNIEAQSVQIRRAFYEQTKS